MNKFLFTGRITDVPELKQKPHTGKAYVFPVVRLKRSWDKDNADFIQVKLFGKVAENFSKYCKKGDLIHFEGSAQQNSYIDSSGNKIFTTEFIVTKFTKYASSSKN